MVVDLGFVVLVVLVQLELDIVDMAQHIIDDWFLLSDICTVHLIDSSASFSINFLGNTFAWSDVLEKLNDISQHNIWRQWTWKRSINSPLPRIPWIASHVLCDTSRSPLWLRLWLASIFLPCLEFFTSCVMLSMLSLLITEVN